VKVIKLGKILKGKLKTVILSYENVQVYLNHYGSGLMNHHGEGKHYERGHKVAREYFDSPSYEG
jgi:hypothetical protein